VTSAHATWFGPVITRAAHSDRDVALTIDAGAGPAAVGVGQQLDAVAVHAAFFTSGREVAAAPDIARQLLRQGHLIGSRAYRGSSAELLDPRSSGLAQAQHLFSERLGICPAFLEPPAGWRTPMLARAVRQRGMAMVTWDVTTEDEGSAAASARAARHILDRVRPGSIINIRLDAATAAGAGSSRLVTEILAGLAHQGLHPVRLDRLLRVPGYSDRC
jgi:peptidoglycan/xylan/chitin deacetylase (PgdA/CDA1 family)